MRNQGFTLIELIVVIAILGILAAFALPRFVDLDKEARVAIVNGIGGSVRASAALAHSVAIAKGAGASDNISMEGSSITMSNKYPTADKAGIGSALQNLDGFSATKVNGNYRFAPENVSDPAKCNVTYAAAARLGSAPNITVTTTDCS